MATPTPSHTSRLKGAITGVCVADALGNPVQFQPRGTFTPITSLRYIPWADMPSGAWSDDGSLTLCLAQSLIDTVGQFDPADTARKFAQWKTHGYYSTLEGQSWDVGMATERACDIWQKAFAKAEARKEKIDFERVQQDVSTRPELISPMSAGNGSLMRVAPVGALLFNEPDKAVEVARAQSNLTHPLPVCADACALYTELMCRVMNGASKGQLVKAVCESNIPDHTLADRLQRYKSTESWHARTEEEIDSSGWVIATFEAALWAFFTTDDWASGALKAVNLGDDSDTVGAVYGGLAGAYYGLEAIPPEWKNGLVKKELVFKVADNLAALCNQINAT